jgi:DNA primase
MQQLRETQPEEQTQTAQIARVTASAPQAELRNTRDFIARIRADNPIEQVIARYVELRPSGRRLVGRCPFHEDRSPSLVVYLNTQSWFCFRCDIGGDVFEFIKRIENISFAEALRGLGSTTSETQVPRRTSVATAAYPVAHALPERSVRFALTEEHFTLLSAATAVYHAAIFTQPWILEYLAKRKIDLDMVRRHRIGYAAGDDLAKYFRFRGWDPEIASDVGLIGPHGEYFRERIVIPELREGKTIYLVGRATQKYQKAKYLGLPGAPKPLYGVELIRGASEVIICEGAFDWLTLIGWGYAAVALLGSHLKPGQVDELAAAERILIATDSDAPGRKAARQLVETLGKRAWIVPPLPNGKDVNEFALRANGRQTFAELVRRVSSSSRSIKSHGL